MDAHHHLEDDSILRSRLPDEADDDDEVMLCSHEIFTEMVDRWLKFVRSVSADHTGLSNYMVQSVRVLELVNAKHASHYLRTGS